MLTIEFIQNVWSAYLAPLGGIAAFVAVLAFLVKLLVNHYYGKAADAYRASLERDKERYKKELEEIAFENQTKFSRLHLQRSEAIMDFHRLLVKAMRAFYAVIYKSGNEVELAANVDGFKASMTELYEADWSKQLLFPRKLAEKVSKFIVQLDASLAGARDSTLRRLRDDLSDNGAAQERTEQNRTKLESEIALLHDSFRMLLGVEDAKI